MTQEQIDKAIKECHWLSDNRAGNLFKGICTSNCLPCGAVIEKGQCDTLIELFMNEGGIKDGKN